ncbi:hypothetical protein TSTA_101420 [Talaromyces stipitatus ATCC 10500]|uniref:Alpha-mannosidase Ams1-like N-terminal domain-containing protein n=1 Tax=Talaromyces stipitatus (strain ATCC 10500 / CBS 375.48 / QM 6759 / NRRL 1006) TaxID=441959 RepID=B8MLN9_TALSN|nr:uncharacterized protein TSTA_101420 [Talaromyces stipitatus ATCC 10500]EED13902.1 hypothetical protein TSTA_101420 [Talaromyces stipitatus ATCC 10500]
MCTGHTENDGNSQYPLRTSGPVGKRIMRLDRNRVGQLYSPGQWEKVNLLSFQEATDESNSYEITQVGQQFGPSWSTQWFKVYITIPNEIKHEKHIELNWDCNNEATVWMEDGTPLQGLTG